MRTPSRSALLALVFGAALSAACSSPRDPVQHCLTASECPSRSRCISQACVANAPPVASFAIPGGTIEANALVSFDASASYDPDAPEDSIVSYAWSFASIDAPCAPPVVASTIAVATVRFACAGTYAATLVATDGMSAASAPATRQVAVARYSGATLVVAGPDMTTGHVCDGLPLRCTTADAVQLSATATADAPEGLSVRWTVEPPPDRPLDAARRVTFSPSAEVADPQATIETDGTAISGDWIFRAEARDGAGVVATVRTRVSVGNSPPVVTATIPASFPHAFSAELSQFTSTGSIPFTISDPDGDAVTGPVMEWRHAGDGGALFDGQDLGTHASFNVIVPYATPPDALLLRGGVDLARSIEISIADPNGAVVQQSWPVVIGNRQPRVAYAGTVSVNHSFDAGSMKYGADATVGTWADDDGDPAIQWKATGDGQCATAAVMGGDAVVHCEMAYPGVPAVQQFAGSHLVEVAIGDPWGEAEPATGVVVAIGNRDPIVLPKTVPVPVSCAQQMTCCRYSEGVCAARDMSYGAGSASGTPSVGDPDADPLIVQVGGDAPYSIVTSTDLVAVEAALDAATTCSASPPSTWVSVAVNDGVAAASGVLMFRDSCL